jgi:ABC-type amino acid transport substrate-binding protein
MKRWMILSLLVITALSIGLAGCAPAAPEVVEKIVEQTVVVEKEVEVEVEVEKEVIITATPEPTVEPLPKIKVASNAQRIIQWYREGDGYDGYEYQVIKEALLRAGYEMEVVDVAFAGIFAGLQAEKWDFACSNIFITEAREAEMDFTTPYHAGWEILATLKESPMEGPEDLAGKTVGTETGTSQAAWLASLITEYGPFETNFYEDAETQWGDLQNGRIDVLATGGGTFIARQNATPLYKVIMNSEASYMVGCAVRTGDTFVEEFDAALNTMKEDGTTAALFEKYFQFPVPEDNPDVTVFTEKYVPTK